MLSSWKDGPRHPLQRQTFRCCPTCGPVSLNALQKTCPTCGQTLYDMQATANEVLPPQDPADFARAEQAKRREHNQ